MIVPIIGLLFLLPYLADRRQKGSTVSSYYAPDVLGWSFKSFAKKAVKVVKKAVDPRTSLKVIKKAANPLTALKVAKQIVTNPLAVKKNLASLAKLDPGIRLATNIARAAKSPAPAKRAAAVRTTAALQQQAKSGNVQAQRVVATASNLTAAVTAAQAAKDAQAARLQASRQAQAARLQAAREAQARAAQEAEALRVVEETPYEDELPPEEPAYEEPIYEDELPPEEPVYEEPYYDENAELEPESDVMGDLEEYEMGEDDDDDSSSPDDHRYDLLGAATDVLGVDDWMMTAHPADVMGWGFNFKKLSIKKIPWGKVTKVVNIVGTGIATVYPPAAPFIAAGLIVLNAAQKGDPKALAKIADIKAGAITGNPTAQAALSALETARNVATAAKETTTAVTSDMSTPDQVVAKLLALKSAAAA